MRRGGVQECGSNKRYREGRGGREIQRDRRSDAITRVAEHRGIRVERGRWVEQKNQNRDGMNGGGRRRDG